MALLVLAAGAVLLVQSAGAQTEPPVSGDWTVGDNTTIENRTVRLYGDLTIVPGGRLVMRNVTLQMFSSSTAIHGIHVMHNATLWVRDLDDDLATSDDGSVVMRGQPAHGYTFSADEDSQIYIINSLVSGAGAAGGPGGVVVKSSYLIIKGSTFIDGWSHGLLMDGVNRSLVQACTFNGSKEGLVLRGCDNVTVEGNTLGDNGRTGLLLDGSNGTMVENCIIADNQLIGLRVVGGNANTVLRTEIVRSPRGVVLESTTGLLLDMSHVRHSIYDGVTIEPGCRNITILASEVTFSSRTGIEVDGVDGLTIESTTVEYSGYFGLRLLNGSTDVLLDSTRVRNNGYDGAHIERASNIVIDGGSYWGNGYNGVFLIDVDNVSLLDTALRNNTYDGLNCDNVVGLVLGGVEAINNSYNGVQLQAGTHNVSIGGCLAEGNVRSGIDLSSAFNLSIRFTARFNGGYGLRVEDGAYDVFGSIRSTNNTGGAVRFQSCSRVWLERCWLQKGPAIGYLVYARDTEDIWISNSTANGTVHLIDMANVSMVNCTFDDVTPDVDGSSQLRFLTVVDVHVLWPNGSPVTGAAVNATGRGGHVLARGTTDSHGMARDLVVLMETYVGEAIAFENPITFFAKRGDEVARNDTNILGWTMVLIVLEDDEDPVAVAPDVDVELGVASRLDGSASTDNGQLVSWIWTFDDGVGTVQLEGRRVNWTFTVLGSFSGMLEVSDSVGHTNFTEFIIHVSDTTAPVVVAGSNVTVDQGGIVPVDGTATTDNDSTLIATGVFIWSVVPETPGSGVRMFSGPILSILFPDMGVYRVELNVTDQSGNTGQAVFWVTVLDTTPPVVDAGPDLEVGEGESLLLEPAEVTDNDPDFNASPSALWHVTGPGTDLTVDGLVVSFLAPVMGVYLATLHVTDAAGNEGTGSLQIIATDRISPVVDIGIDRTVEVLTQVTLDAGNVTDNDPGFPVGATYVWSVQGPKMDTEEHRGDSITFTIPWIGEYVIALTVTDAAGNSGAGSVTYTSVDTASPVFGTFLPTPLNVSETADVTVSFVVTDEGTGVDLETLEMRTRSPSNGTWSGWERVTDATGVHRVDVTMVMPFPEGTSVLQLRCWDQAGNGPVTSEEHTIRVNSRPVVMVLSPKDGATYDPSDEIMLDASASSDPDGDALTFVWSSDLDGVLGGNATVRAPTLSEGTHLITVRVSDGITGHDVIFQVTITVRPAPSTIEPDEGIPWWVLAAAVLLFAGFALVLWDHRRRRRRPPPAEGADEWMESSP